MSSEAEKTSKAGLFVSESSLLLPARADSSPAQWDNEAHMKLCLVLADALTAAGGSINKNSDAVIASLQAYNLNVSWNAVRWVFFCFAFCFAYFVFVCLSCCRVLLCLSLYSLCPPAFVPSAFPHTALSLFRAYAALLLYLPFYPPPTRFP